MKLWAILQLLILLAIANGAPVFAKDILGTRWAWPLDAGAMFLDGRPLLGASKTCRGVVVSIVLTAICAVPVGLDVLIGALVGATAMAGDLASSFVKRRLARPPSSRATGLDQIPEALFPALGCQHALDLSALDVLAVVVTFFVAEVLLSRVLYRYHLRDRPY